ncbi:MAG: HIT family protein [Dissulfurispiraceae bacterium]|jgi:diadenosine tetraphosphate (Ap4A) HIT family hydrolase|nr:HIT family protein [Dissulfurispiraceae bacterium]
MFELNERLKQDTFEVARLQLSKVLLMNDMTVPWLILVPQRSGIRELHQLEQKDLTVLVEETALVSGLMEKEFSPDKINVASLGNIVAQLHVHIVARFSNDRAWPGPVWGAAGAEQYTEHDAAKMVKRISAMLKF